MKADIPELDAAELVIINTPFSELTKEQRAAAFAISDKIFERNKKLNKAYLENEAKNPKSAAKITIHMTDKLLENGVKSPINGESYSNRHSWNEHLKANGCVEIGNDFNNAKPREDVRGDFNCRKELGEATYRVMEKYGY